MSWVEYVNERKWIKISNHKYTFHTIRHVACKLFKIRMYLTVLIIYMLSILLIVTSFYILSPVMQHLAQSVIFLDCFKGTDWCSSSPRWHPDADNFTEAYTNTSKFFEVTARVVGHNDSYSHFVPNRCDSSLGTKQILTIIWHTVQFRN